MTPPKDSKKTRAKIIKAAGQLFAEKGDTGVTVREIVKKARIPLGAVNCHLTRENLPAGQLFQMVTEVARVPVGE